MRRAAGMQGWWGRVLHVIVAAAMALPVGIVPAWASPRVGEFRPKATRGSAAEVDLARDLGGVTSPLASSPVESRAPAITLLAQRVTAVSGARTGEVSIDAAIAAGATGIIAGHSETRPGSPTPLRDSNEEINAQIRAAAARPEVHTIILAVGEQTEGTDAAGVNDRDVLLGNQLRAAVRGLTAEDLTGRLVVAYEPRWAIAGSGQGRPATPEYAQSAHRAIRGVLTNRYGDAFAAQVRIIYGGSATADNATQYLTQDDIDGLLPGGASTTTSKLAPILHAAQSVAAEKHNGRRLLVAGNQKTYEVAQSPADFAAALASVDSNLVDVAVAPTLTQLSAWSTAFSPASTPAAAEREQTSAYARLSTTDRPIVDGIVESALRPFSPQEQEQRRDLVSNILAARYLGDAGVDSNSTVARLITEAGLDPQLAKAYAQQAGGRTLLAGSARAKQVPVTDEARWNLLPGPTQAFSQDEAVLTSAQQLEVVDESDQPRLLKEGIASGEVFDLGDERYVLGSHQQDVARTEERTRVLTRDPADKGEYNRWKNTDEYQPKVLAKMRGASAGKTDYVMPYLMSPPGSPLEQAAIGVEVTDSLPVTLNGNIMFRTGEPALKALGDGTVFEKGRHVTGNLETIKRGNPTIGFGDDVDERDFFTVADERELDHYGSAYGGNALLGKIGHGLRQASYDGSKGFALGKKWLAEQMGLMEIEIQDIETGKVERYGVVVAAPSGSGKTNLVMLDKMLEVNLNGRPSRVKTNLLGDDISWIWVGDNGQMRAFNPENGIFGIAPGTNGRTNASAMKAIGPGSGTLFTNTGVNKVTKQVFWEGLTTEDFDWIGDDGYPKDLTGWQDWKRQLITDRPAEEQRNPKFPWAHANSRFTTSLTNFKNLSPRWNDPNGIPIHMVLLGGRSQTDPLIRESRDPAEGLYEAFIMGVEATAAAEGKAGEFREDPFSMRPFYGLDEEAHLENWFDNIERAGSKAPKFYRTNWFRKSADGKFIWPGYGENLRALLWAIERLNDQGKFVQTPLGNVPTQDALHLEGSDISQAQIAALVSTDPQAIAGEVVRRQKHLALFPNLPQPIRQAHQRFVSAYVTETLANNPAISAAVAQYARGGWGNTEASNRDGLKQALTKAGVPEQMVGLYQNRAVEVATAKKTETTPTAAAKLPASTTIRVVEQHTVPKAMSVTFALQQLPFKQIDMQDFQGLPKPGLMAVVRRSGNDSKEWEPVKMSDEVAPGDELALIHRPAGGSDTGPAEAGRVHLRAIAAQMVPPTGGILAADESAGTAGKRLDSVTLENTPENRQAMRQVLLTAPGLKASGIDAVILDRDTLTNTTPDGKTTLVAYLRAQNIVPGLKTDEGLVDDPAYPDVPGLKRLKDANLEKLPAVLALAKEHGLSFTKFRTTVPGSGAPEANMRENAHAQAAQAKLAQAAGLVPMVEPEVTFDGSDGSAATHDLATSYTTTTQMLELTFEELVKENVALEGMILKTSMILAGKKAPAQTDAETVGRETLKALLKTVPAAVPAVVFLSGGQSDDQATTNLAAVTRVSQTRFAEVRDAAVAELRAEGKTARAAQVAALTQAPWELSYSFGRGLQAKALAAWAGQPEQVADAQRVMTATAREVQAARQGIVLTEGEGRDTGEILPAAAPISTATSSAESVAQAQARANAESPLVDPIPNPTPSPVYDAVVVSGANLVATNHRGDALGVTDKTQVNDLKVASDGVAKLGVQAVLVDAGYQAVIQVSEGFGRDGVDESFRGAERVNFRGLARRILRLLIDVIDGTTKFETNNDGLARAALGLDEAGGMGTVVMGDGIEVYGNAPDAYADQIFARVRNEKQAAVQRLIEESVTAEDRDTIQRVLQAIAEGNGKTINDLQLVIMKRTREGKRMEALKAIKAEFPGLQITEIGDGTVAHGLLATLGRKEGKVKVMWTVGGSAEAFMNLAVASSVQGAVGVLRLYSKEVQKKTAEGGEATDLSRRYEWTDKEQAELRDLRPDDADAVITGNRLFSVRDVPADLRGTIEGNFSFLTDNGVFNQPGVQEIEPGLFRVHTLRITGGTAGIVVRDIAKADVEQLLARATWVAQEPAAADPAVVDDTNTLLGLMENSEQPRTILVHQDVSAQTPGFFIAWQRALERLRTTRNLRTLDDAARGSAVKLQLFIEPVAGHAQDAAAAVAELVDAVNRASGGVTQLKSEWFTSTTSRPSEPVAGAIGPSDWLKSVAEAAPVKIAFDEAENGKVRSGAAALHGVAGAIAGNGTLPQAAAKRLDLEQLEELLVPQVADIVAEAQPAIHTYRQTIAGTVSAN